MDWNYDDLYAFKNKVLNYKEDYMGEKMGDYVFGGAGNKCIKLNASVPEDSVFVSYEDVLSEKSRTAKAVFDYFFKDDSVEKDETPKSINEIINIINDNLDDSQKEILIEKIKKDDAKEYIGIEDVLGVVDVEKYYDDFLTENKMSLKSLNTEKKLLVLVHAIIRFYNHFDGGDKIDVKNEDAYHFAFIKKSDVINYISDNPRFRLFRAHGVEAIADMKNKLIVRLIR